MATLKYGFPFLVYVVSCVVSAAVTGPAGGCGAPLLAQDEGMWLLNRPPLKWLQEHYDFTPSQAWLRHVQRSSLKVGGASGAFVSRDGLVLTNQHVARRYLQKLSTAHQDLVRDGYLAHGLEDELKLPNLTIKQLESIVDVTAQVLRGVDEAASPEDKMLRRRANIASIESAASHGVTLGDVVTLDLGAQFHLYTYRVYKDVRLVFAPEGRAASFAHEQLNFEYPRYSFDVTFMRVYENDKPITSDDYFQLSPSGVRSGELVFVSGHPGTTNRLFTASELRRIRDDGKRYVLPALERRIKGLRAFAESSPEHARQSASTLQSAQNSHKSLAASLRGLDNPDLFSEKALVEDMLRPRADLALRTLEVLSAETSALEPYRSLISAASAFDSVLFDFARTLLRRAVEDVKPNPERLPGYQEANRNKLKRDLLSTAPIYPKFEIAKLTTSLKELSEQLGPRDLRGHAILKSRAAREFATLLVKGTRLIDPKYREELLQLSADDLAKIDDPMLQLARQVEADARALQARFESQILLPREQAYREIAAARRQLFGDLLYPDATSTLRLAYGRVLAYSDGQNIYRAWTTIGQAVQSPLDTFPPAWIEPGHTVLNPVPLNFISTADTIGGNSGSPVFNRLGQLLGVNFDSNGPKLERQKYQYAGGSARHISVDVRAIRLVLAHVYHATRLVGELERSTARE